MTSAPFLWSSPSGFALVVEVPNEWEPFHPVIGRGRGGCGCGGGGSGAGMLWGLDFWRSAMDMHRDADRGRVEKEDRHAFREADASMRCRVAGENAGVKSVCAIEPQEILHGRGDEFSPLRHGHVHIRIPIDDFAIGIHQLSVEGREMVQILLQHREIPRGSKVPGAAARNRRLVNDLAVLQETCFLLCEIDVDGDARICRTERKREEQKQKRRQIFLISSHLGCHGS